MPGAFGNVNTSVSLPAVYPSLFKGVFKTAQANHNANSYVTVLQVTSGKGTLLNVSLRKAVGFNNADCRVTVDGGTPVYLLGSGASTLLVLFIALHIRFETSLLIEINNGDATGAVHGIVYYTLE
jgi:hypothetical protein